MFAFTIACVAWLLFVLAGLLGDIGAAMGIIVLDTVFLFPLASFIALFGLRSKEQRGYHIAALCMTGLPLLLMLVGSLLH